MGSSSPGDIIGYWNTVIRYPGLSSDYTSSPMNTTAFPTEERVMSASNSQRDGAWASAPA